MTARFPLFDFMPYGAPELMAAARGHMARAQAASCALMIMLFAAALALVPRIVSTPDIVVVDPRPHAPESYTPNYEPLRPRVPQTAITHGPRTGEIVPVRDDVRQDIVPPGDIIGNGDGTSQGVIDVGPVQSGPPVFEAPLPARGDFTVVDEMPVSIKEVKPEYPDMARDIGLEGTVLVHFLIGKDGRVLRAELDEKVHVPMLDAVTLEAAKKWVFTPAMTNGHPVPVWEAVPFVFTLH